VGGLSVAERPVICWSLGGLCVAERQQRHMGGAGSLAMWRQLQCSHLSGNWVGSEAGISTSREATVGVVRGRALAEVGG